MVHRQGGVIVVDGAQSVPHMKVDVQELDVDFLRLFRAQDDGADRDRRTLRQGIPARGDGAPGIRRGDDRPCRSVRIDLERAPLEVRRGNAHHRRRGRSRRRHRLSGIGGDGHHPRHDQELAAYAQRRLEEIEGITIYGPRENRTGLVTFNLEGVHPHDVATVLDTEGIAVRAGHHCAQPLMRWLGVTATAGPAFTCTTMNQTWIVWWKAIRQDKGVFRTCNWMICIAASSWITTKIPATAARFDERRGDHRHEQSDLR